MQQWDNSNDHLNQDWFADMISIIKIRVQVNHIDESLNNCRSLSWWDIGICNLVEIILLWQLFEDVEHLLWINWLN